MTARPATPGDLPSTEEWTTVAELEASLAARRTAMSDTEAVVRDAAAVASSILERARTNAADRATDAATAVRERAVDTAARLRDAGKAEAAAIQARARARRDSDVAEVLAAVLGKAHR